MSDNQWDESMVDEHEMLPELFCPECGSFVNTELVKIITTDQFIYCEKCGYQIPGIKNYVPPRKIQKPEIIQQNQLQTNNLTLKSINSKKSENFFERLFKRLKEMMIRLNKRLKKAFKKAKAKTESALLKAKAKTESAVSKARTKIDEKLKKMQEKKRNKISRQYKEQFPPQRSVPTQQQYRSQPQRTQPYQQPQQQQYYQPQIRTVQTVSNRPAPNFDPLTGKRIIQPQTTQEQQHNFDPITGKPLNIANQQTIKQPSRPIAPINIAMEQEKPIRQKIEKQETEKIETDKQETADIEVQKAPIDEEKEILEELFTVLDNDVRDSLLKLPLNPIQKEIIAKSFIYLTNEQQKKYLEEIRSANTSLDAEMVLIVNKISQLNLSKSDKDFVISQLNFIPDEEQHGYYDEIKQELQKEEEIKVKETKTIPAKKVEQKTVQKEPEIIEKPPQKKIEKKETPIKETVQKAREVPKPVEKAPPKKTIKKKKRQLLTD
jgi:hypothetical protein